MRFAWTNSIEPAISARITCTPVPRSCDRQAAIDAFCDFAGTGGSFAGCAAAFKERDAGTECFLIEPENCAVLAGHSVIDPRHRIQGGGYALRELPLLRAGLVDGYLSVTDQAAMAAARRLAREEGIFAGFSSGANLAALQICRAGPWSF